MLKGLKHKLNKDMHFKEILTGSAITFVLKMSGMLLGYLVVLMISRRYGAEDLGVYSLTLSIITFLAMVGSMGMNVSILRYAGQFNKSDEEYKLKLLYHYALKLVFPFSLFLAILLYFFSGILAENVFHNISYKPALEFAAFIVPFMALQNISVEFIRGLKKLKVSEFLRSVNISIINVSLLFIAGLFVVNHLLPIYTLGIGIIISAILAIYLIHKRIYKIECKKASFSKAELLMTSLPMMITTVASFVLGNISLFVLEIFSTTENVGIFSVIMKIALLITLALTVVNTISAPKFSELYWDKKMTELQQVINDSSKLIFFTSLLIAITLLIFSKPILSLFGEKFLEGNIALILLILGQVVNSFTGSVGYFMNMSGKHKAYKNIMILSLILNIVLSFILIPKYGIDGAAIATLISISLLNILASSYVKIKYGITTYYIPTFLRIKQ